MDERKAKRLITHFLREIAEEETETVCVEGEDRMVTKAESLAREMWRMALGWNEVRITAEGPKDIEHKPDKGMMAAIIDRTEGRAVPATGVGKPARTIADKVSEQGVDRIAKAGNVDDN
ncbi:unnamed protein product [marine sediment metagenome]|uniref:Uncharacterized protein n=1 Tax=marine sediment metagenome TaxID=412755 RepID=X0T1X3_9ZZZZ